MVSRGFAELSSAAAQVGSAAADRVAAAVGRLLGCEVRISGRALPSCPGEGRGCARLLFELPALPGTALVEIDSALVVSAVDRLAGGTGATPGAIALTPVEMTVLELLALVSLEALCKLDVVRLKLAPRLCRSGAPPVSSLGVELELTIGDQHGRARLLVPPAAIRAFRGDPDLPETLARAAVSCSVRQGSALLSQEELSALCTGDVVLLDPNPVDLLALAGGCRVHGQLAADRFLVEEIS